MSKDSLLSLCLIPVSFFLMLFVSIPVIKSIWNMLVYPSYPIRLQSGVIIFVILISSLLKFKVEKNDSVKFQDNCIKVISYYFTLLGIWGISWIYSVIIK